MVSHSSCVWQSRYYEESRLDDQITQLIGQGATDNPLPESLEYWKSQVARLEQQVGLDEEKRKKLIALQREASNLEKQIFNAQRELQNFDSVLTPRRKQAVEKRFRIYMEYFDLLEEEVKILEELYEPLRASLMDKEEHEKKLTLYIRTSVDIGTWVSRGEELIDQRKLVHFECEEVCLKRLDNTSQRHGKSTILPRLRLASRVNPGV